MNDFRCSGISLQACMDLFLISWNYRRYFYKTDFKPRALILSIKHGGG
jgi:hypothetical protein